MMIRIDRPDLEAVAEGMDIVKSLISENNEIGFNF
jgi:hypothetical protein